MDCGLGDGGVFGACRRIGKEGGSSSSSRGEGIGVRMRMR